MFMSIILSKSVVMLDYEPYIGPRSGSWIDFYYLDHFRFFWL